MRTVAPLLRIAVTIALLWWTLSRVDLASALGALGHAAPLPLLGAVLMIAATAPFNALRWRIILRAEGAPLPGLTLLKLVWLGVFFNQMLPSGVGGDAVRAWRCQRLGIRLGAALRSILLDRAAGYTLFVVLFAVELPRLLRGVDDPSWRWVIVLVLAAALGGLAALPLFDRLPRLVARLPGFEALAGLSRATRRLVRDPARLAAILLLSAVTVSETCLAYAFFGVGVGAPVGIATWFAIVPPVTLLQLAPVSLAGWGVRELSLVVIAKGFGIPAETALAVSLLFGMGQILLALPGGAVWLTGWDLKGQAERR